MTWQWAQPFLRFMADDYGLADVDALIKAAETIEARGGKTWGVLRNGRLCGWLGFELANSITGIGHCLFAKWAWGRETTDVAIRMCLAEIFALGYERVSCPFLATNQGIRALLKRVGMRDEGTLRNYTRCGGVVTDMVMTGIVKADFENANGSGSTNHGGTRRNSGHRGEYERGAYRNAELDLDGHDEWNPDELVFADPDGAAGHDSGRTEQPHHARSGPDTRDDDGHANDQRHVQGNRRQSLAKPGGARVRKQRSQRNRSAANGTS